MSSSRAVLHQSRATLGAALAAILAMQPACIAKIDARCPLVTGGRPAPALPPDIASLDDLLYRRAVQMMHDVRGLNGSATVSFHIWFAYETLPLWCARMDQARELAKAGLVSAAGRKYQALLVFSQMMELAIAVHAVVEYADAVKEPSLVLVRTVETFGNQMEPILVAVLSEDPREIERALKAHPAVFQQWRDYLERWMVHIHADAERMKVAKVAWDVTIGVIAAYETAGSLVRLATSGRPPPPLPAVATIGGGTAAVAMSPVAHLELAEAIRRLVASGALDAGVVAALAAVDSGTPVHLPVSSKMAGREKLPGVGDADYRGPLPKRSWKTTPEGDGVHLVDRGPSKGNPTLAKFARPDTPRYYPGGSPENAGQAHLRIHDATREIGKIDLKKPLGGFRTERELIDAYRRAYADPRLLGIRGDLRTPDGKNVIASNLSPAEAFAKLMEWARSTQ